MARCARLKTMKSQYWDHWYHAKRTRVQEGNPGESGRVFLRAGQMSDWFNYFFEANSGPNGNVWGVRGVGAGGIVSTAFCLLYKLHTLKPTRKQIMSMIKYKDAPNIRALGFLFIRYTQPPDQLWNWFNKYLEDKEEVDASSNGGPLVTIGTIVRNMLTKLEWYSTLFPRIPIPIQKDIEKKLEEFDMTRVEEKSHPRESEKHSKSKRDDEERGDGRSGSRGKGNRRSRDRSIHRESSSSSSRRENHHSSSRSGRDYRDDRHRRRSHSREARWGRSCKSSSHQSRSRDTIRVRSRERRRYHR